VASEDRRFARLGFRLAGLLGLIWLNTMSGWPQTRDLATTDDGSKLYFSSTLRLRGTGDEEFGNGKIFEYSNGTYALIAQMTPTATLSDGSVFQFDLRMPSVSGDGSILTYDGTASCTGGDLCLGSFTTSGYIDGAKVPPDMTWYGSLRISHNGSYALSFGGERGVLPYQEPSSLFDIQSGAYTYLLTGTGCLLACTILGDGRQSMADDGTVLTGQGLWNNGQVTPLGLSSGPILMRISADGSMVVYESVVSSQCFGGQESFGWCNVNNVLTAHLVATGAETPIAIGPTYMASLTVSQPQTYFFPSLSDDGQLVLYRQFDTESSQPQVFLSATDGSTQRKLTGGNAGIAEAVISGDGHHAYAVTESDDLLSIDLDSGEVQNLPNQLRPRSGHTGSAKASIGDHRAAAN
jgi:hypothetical protein